MPTPTTLITFRVQTPPSTRSVELFGSWDNFTTAYSMRRDTQYGSGQWSGCHSFSNIICDGNVEAVSTSRCGGLRMGGTYWYYYRLDDDTEYYNTNERTTTSCPLLPGQMVNMLQIPYAFSGSRSRDSSTSSEKRTMNPEDKFVNPRQPPPRPREVRVTTSPTLPSIECTTKTSSHFLDHQSCNAKVGDDLSQTRFRGLTKKVSLDSFPTRGVDHKNLGLRAALTLRTARSQSPDPLLRVPMNHRHQRAVSAERQETASRSAMRELSSSRSGDLHLRSESAKPFTPLSFEQHRRQRSRSRENAKLRHAASVESLASLAGVSLGMQNHEPLDTLEEVLSPQAKEPILDSAAQLKQELNLQKRLPTLPNTPSSAYPPTLPADSPERRMKMTLDNLDSHFSATTIDTDHTTALSMHNETSRFSAWTTSTGIDSMLCNDSAPELPPLDHDLFASLAARPFDSLAELPMLSSAFSCSSMSSAPSISWLDTDEDSEAPNHLDTTSTSPAAKIHYSLPEDEYTSAITIKALPTKNQNNISEDMSHVKDRRPSPPKIPEPEIVHSESMQRLLDELSYLSGMIQH